MVYSGLLLRKQNFYKDIEGAGEGGRVAGLQYVLSSSHSLNSVVYENIDGYVVISNSLILNVGDCSFVTRHKICSIKNVQISPFHTSLIKNPSSPSGSMSNFTLSHLHLLCKLPINTCAHMHNQLWGYRDHPVEGSTYESGRMYV